MKRRGVVSEHGASRYCPVPELRCDGLLFVALRAPIDTFTVQRRPAYADQVRRSVENVGRVAVAPRTRHADAVRVGVQLADLSRFPDADVAR